MANANSTTTTIRPVTSNPTPKGKALKLTSKAPKAPKPNGKANGKAKADAPVAGVAQAAQATAAQSTTIRDFTLTRTTQATADGRVYVPAIVLGLAVLAAHKGTATKAQILAAVQEQHPKLTSMETLLYVGKVKRRLVRKGWAVIRNAQ